MQSRYYDPGIGRFLNADAFASTGQGILGNNMFVYCNNNPVCLSDTTGHCPCALTSRFDSNFMYNTTMCLCGGGAGGGTAFSTSNKSSRLENLVANKSEAAVLNAERFAFYKGTLVIKVPGDSAFSFGIIFFGEDIKSANLVRHEYGHTVQLHEPGIGAYLATVVIPSVTCYWLDVPANIYYSLPWEYTADMYGDVTWEHTYWAETVGNIYWDIAKHISAGLGYYS